MSVYRGSAWKFSDRFREWANGTVMPWRCVWANHVWVDDYTDWGYKYRCIRPGCSAHWSPA